MLRCVIVVSKLCDVRDSRPLNARSLALSALLGTHPPRLPAHGLVALAELFGMRPGTMRTALSRLVAAGDVVNDGGDYVLTERLLTRQASQDAGRRLPATPWNGDWHVVTSAVDQRDLDDRRRARRILDDARFGELRPDTWLRPANLPAPDLHPGWGGEWIVTTGPARGPGPTELAGRLWDLDAIAGTAHRLAAALEHTAATLLGDDPAAIPPAFEVSARVVRFLRAEPLLPDELLPAGWPVAALRERYDAVEAALQARLRPFLRATAV